MKPLFAVKVVRFAILEELQDVWADEDFVRMLDTMDYGDTAGIAPAELRELCLLSLQDLKPREAAELVLKARLSGRLTAGEIRNCASEMLDQKLWEEFADLSLHEQMFNVGSLLYSAFPRVFPEPDAVRVTLEVEALNEAAQAALANPSAESFLVRLLADGMDADSILHRLFHEQLLGRSFPEADTIVWTVQTESLGKDKTEIDIISSGYWLDSLRDTRSYQSNAYADEASRRCS